MDVTIRARDTSTYARLLDVLGGDRGFTVLPGGENPTRHLHIGFAAQNRQQVDAFWQAGRDAGWADDGAPGPRPQYRPDYYGGFLKDPDGNSVEAVHHGDARRGDCVDHLWIGVGDLAASVAYYAALANHLGLRTGVSIDHGQQFRGAWSTFMLVADGRPPTANLELTFPVPEPLIVQEFAAAGRPRDPDGTRVSVVLRG
jgi:catechol 2,3-dioxygenase-like lactoylglutathione lyase family enzyme